MAMISRISRGSGHSPLIGVNRGKWVLVALFYGTPH